jgi:hypothetical protein
MKHKIFNTSTLFYCCFFIVVAGLYVVFSLALQLGFDVTDEGFYLMTVSAPESYLHTASMFGGVLAPLWSLSTENVFVYRLLQWWILLALSFVLFSALLRRSYEVSTLLHYLLAATFSLSVVGYLYNWLPTPSYNTLALTALLTFSISVLFFEDWNYPRIVSMALAATVAFLSKPTTAAALAIVSVILCIYAPSAYSIRRRALALVIVGLLCASMICFFAFISMGSPYALYLNLYDGVQYGSLLMGDQWSSIFNILWVGEFRGFNLTVKQLSVLGVFALTLIVIITTKVNTSPSNYLKSLASLFFAGLIMIGLAVIFGFVENPLKSASIADRFVISAGAPLLVLIVSIAALIYNGTLRAQSALYCGTLVFLPYAFAVGTSTNYYGVIASSYVFFYAACLALGGHHKSNLLVYSLAVCALVTSIFSMPIGGKSVYRQPAFSDPALNISDFELSTSGRLEGLYLQPSSASYLNQLSRIAIENGFTRGDDVIDLTGASSGAIFAMGGQSVGSAWLLGGYPGSVKSARQRLTNIDKTRLEQSWLLMENWKRSIDVDVLGMSEEGFSQSYEKVGSVIIPKGLGGRRESHIQTLYSPKKALQNGY